MRSRPRGSYRENMPVFAFEVQKRSKTLQLCSVVWVTAGVFWRPKPHQGIRNCARYAGHGFFDVLMACYARSRWHGFLTDQTSIDHGLCRVRVSAARVDALLE